MKDFTHQEVTVIIERQDQHVMSKCLWTDGTEKADKFIDLLITILGEFPIFQYWQKGRPFGPLYEDPDKIEELLTISLSDYQINQILKHADNLNDESPYKRPLKNICTSLQRIEDRGVKEFLRIQSKK